MCLSLRECCKKEICLTLEAKIKFFTKFTESVGRINSGGDFQRYGAAYEVSFLKMHSLGWGRTL